MRTVAAFARAVHHLGLNPEATGANLATANPVEADWAVASFRTERILSHLQVALQL